MDNEKNFRIFKRYMSLFLYLSGKTCGEISDSIRGITAMLHRLGMSYTRPTYVLAKADKEKQEQFKEDFEDIRKLLNGEIQHILFEAESMIRDYQAIHQTWFECGKQLNLFNHS